MKNPHKNACQSNEPSCGISRKLLTFKALKTHEKGATFRLLQEGVNQLFALCYNEALLSMFTFYIRTWDMRRFRLEQYRTMGSGQWRYAFQILRKPR